MINKQNYVVCYIVINTLEKRKNTTEYETEEELVVGSVKQYGQCHFHWEGQV